MPVCIICGAPNSEEKTLRYFDLPTSMYFNDTHKVILFFTTLCYIQDYDKYTEFLFILHIFLGISNPEWHSRFMNELGIIVESDNQLKNMKICEVG